MTLFASATPTPGVLQPVWAWEAPFRRLRITPCPGALVLSVTSPQLLDDAAAESLERELRAAVTRSAARAVVLDLADVRAITSALCTVLVGLHELVSQRGGRLLLCGLSGHVAEVLRLTGILGPRPAPLKAVADVATAIARLAGRLNHHG